MKSNKKVWIITLIIALSGALLVGGISMITKKTLKEETLRLDEIHAINISANMADVNISLTDGNDLRIIQYSQKRVDATYQYDTVIENGMLTILDKSRKAPYFLGSEGSPGISYEIHLPASYSGSMRITLNQGNIVMRAGDGIFTLNGVNIENTGMGNISIDTLTVTADSEISVGSGNINLTLSRDTDCRVTAQAGSGNVTVADAFSNGAYDMVITSTRGNITIIGKVVD